jgi:hypothetical protein
MVGAGVFFPSVPKNDGGTEGARDRGSLIYGIIIFLLHCSLGFTASCWQRPCFMHMLLSFRSYLKQVNTGVFNPSLIIPVDLKNTFLLIVQPFLAF